MEIWGGNIEMLVALAIVLGFRWPATWSFVLLTKITPGIGLLWFAVRREWRSLAIALAATAAVVAVSSALMPDAWRRWLEVLPPTPARAGRGRPSRSRSPSGFPFGNRPGVVGGSHEPSLDRARSRAMLALPALWYGGLSIMLATLPLVGARSWSDLRRVRRKARVSSRPEPGPAGRAAPAGGRVARFDAADRGATALAATPRARAS